MAAKVWTVVVLAAALAASTVSTASASQGDAPGSGDVVKCVLSSTYNPKTKVVAAAASCNKNITFLKPAWSYTYTRYDKNKKVCRPINPFVNGQRFVVKPSGAYRIRVVFNLFVNGTYYGLTVRSIITGGTKVCGTASGPLVPSLCEWRDYPNINRDPDVCGKPPTNAPAFKTAITLGADGTTVTMGDIVPQPGVTCSPITTLPNGMPIPSNTWLGSPVQGKALSCSDGTVVQAGVKWVQQTTSSGTVCPVLAPPDMITYPSFTVPVTLGGKLSVYYELIVNKYDASTRQWSFVANMGESNFIFLKGSEGEDRCMTNSG